MLKIGIAREGKIPPDFRVPLTPEQCRFIKEKYAEQVDILVQKSPIRTFKDEEYSRQGIQLVDDLQNCDLIMGVKEFPIADLIPGKTYLFFSHTIKMQAYNRKLLQAIMEKHISLIDYEVIKDEKGKRLIGFGEYAGIVGCYNGFRTYGLKTGCYNLVKAVETNDRKLVEKELEKVDLPKGFKMILTGFGRVGNGAMEIIDLLPIKQVTAEEFLSESFEEPVFAHLDTHQYYRRKSDGKFDKKEFYHDPSGYESNLWEYLESADMYIPCHFWSDRSPVLVTKEQLRTGLQRLKVIADISCDINKPIASTIRPSTIADPIYGYNRLTGEEDNFMNEGVLAVMAVDNLPCELPKDASRDFGREFTENVLPYLLSAEASPVIENARITDHQGRLTSHFSYLTDYVSKVEI